MNGTKQKKIANMTKAEALDILAAALIAADELGLTVLISKPEKGGVIVYLPEVAITEAGTLTAEGGTE